MCDKQNLQISPGACTSSILRSPKREVDRVNQLSEHTTCWHKFVPFLVLGLPWVPRLVFILTRTKSLWKGALFKLTNSFMTYHRLRQSTSIGIQFYGIMRLFSALEEMTFSRL